MLTILLAWIYISFLICLWGILFLQTIKRITKTMKSGKLDLRNLRPCTQLAVFRWVRDNTNYNEDVIDKMMTDWLVRLGKSQKTTALPLIEMDLRMKNEKTSLQ